MKNLSEQEILARLYAKKDTCEASYAEIPKPDYEAWGRARGWELHQAACLISDLAPLSKKHFELLMKTKSVLNLKWHPCYPISQTDRNQLENVYCLLSNSSYYNDLKDSSKEYISISPKALLNYCKKDEKLRTLLPIDLLKVVSLYGAHTSFALPEFFSSLDIDPEAIYSLKKPADILPQIKEEKPSSRDEISKEQLLHYPCRRLKDEQLARKNARSIAALLWKKSPKFKQTKILGHPLFSSTMSAFAKEIGKPEGFSEETLRNWIRDLDPGYKPRNS